MNANKEEKSREETTLQKRNRAKTRFSHEEVKEMAAIISETKPSAKTARVRTNDALAELRETLISAHERGCSLRDVYDSLKSKGVEMSESAFQIFWRKYVSKKTEIKKKKGTKSFQKKYKEETEENTITPDNDLTKTFSSNSIQSENKSAGIQKTQSKVHETEKLFTQLAGANRRQERQN